MSPKTSYLLLIFLIIFSKNSYCVLLEMVNCPDSSYCTKESLDLYNQWQKALQGTSSELTDFTKKIGVPFNIWSNKKPDDPTVLYWNSHLKHHFKKNLFILQPYIKQINDLSSFTLTEKLYLLRNQKVEIYTIPAKEYPLTLMNNSLVFRQESDGNYYYLHITLEGKLSISKNMKRSVAPSLVECPPELIFEFDAHKENKLLYRHPLCKKIVDQSSQKEFIYLIGFPGIS